MCLIYYVWNCFRFLYIVFRTKKLDKSLALATEGNDEVPEEEFKTKELGLLYPIKHGGTLQFSVFFSIQRFSLF